MQVCGNLASKVFSFVGIWFWHFLPWICFAQRCNSLCQPLEVHHGFDHSCFPWSSARWVAEIALYFWRIICVGRIGAALRHFCSDFILLHFVKMRSIYRKNARILPAGAAPGAGKRWALGQLGARSQPCCQQDSCRCPLDTLEALKGASTFFPLWLGG